MTVVKLAVDGGAPEFEHPLHVGSPNLPDEERVVAAVRSVLRSRRLTNFGPVVGAFEERLAELTGFAHAVATCNATVGLEIATRALGFRDEAIVPAWTFVATAHALRWQGVRPLFADVTRQTHHLDPVSVERMMTPAVSGIVGVHLWGSRLDLRGLRALADAAGVPLVVDAAHAFATEGGTDGTRMKADAEVLSFHATKFLNTFEGGAVLTDDPALAADVRSMTNFGFAGRDRVDAIGTNGKMSEVAAAMGLASLEGLDRLLEINERNFEAYRQRLRFLPGLRLLEPGSPRHNRQYVVVEVDAAMCGLGRDALVTCLQAENVDARRYFAPGVHRMEPYASEQPNADLLLPVTTALADEVLVLPTGSNVDVDAIERIVDLLERIVERASTRPRPASIVSIDERRAA